MSSPGVPRPKPAWYVHIADFANMLKAFIGSNYLSVSFAFLQSGLGLGICGLVFIASLTDHCCHLIVKTKYHAIRNILQLHNINQNEFPKPKINTNGATFHSRKYSLSSDDEDTDRSSMVHTRGQSSDDDEEEYVIFDVDEETFLEQHLMKHMSYGDVGRISFGKVGISVVNICIAMTQFGFCVAYFIFIGNTLYSMFPYQVCVNNISNDTNSNVSTKNLTLESTCKNYYIDLGPQKQIQNYSFHETKRNFDDTHFISTTKLPVLEERHENTSHTSRNESDSTNLTTQAYTLSSEGISTETTTFTGTSYTHNTNDSTTSTTTSTEITTGTTKHGIDWNEISAKVLETTAPSLKLLVPSPLPLFIIFALIRTVRNLGFISVIANTAILIGCVSVFFYLFIDFKVSEDVVWFKWDGFPVFFGMVTAAFEGIGLVIPVESSMEGNRHNFNRFLHGAVFVLSLVLGVFGIFGYLRFGDNLHQMINTNIPSDTWVSFSVNICIALGVLLTFPLQIYPVIELLEIALFSEGSILGPKKEHKLTLEATSEDTSADGNDQEALLPKDSPPPIEMPGSVAVHIPESVPTWKRNILRVVVVLCAAGLAVIFRDSFAYVGAFTGAVGSSLLAYILPCLFHLKLCKDELPYPIIIKDVVIIIVGICCSIISLYSVILSLIHNTIV